jgi:replicative DNA helicase
MNQELTRNKVEYKSEKIDLQLNIDMADLLLEYAISNKPSRNHQANLKQLLDVVDMDVYKSSYEIKDRLYLIRSILDLKLNEEVTKLALLKEQCKQNNPDLVELINNTTWSNSSLQTNDIKLINKWIEEHMQFYYFYVEMPSIVNIWESCMKQGFNLNIDALNEVNDRMNRLIVKMKNTEISTGILRQFNFAAPNVADLIKFTVEKAQKPSAILQTGIRNLNAILGPGFRGGKLYTILGMSGKFKSGTLLNIADQITKFNPSLEKVTNGKRNTLLFITMENSIEETVERLFGMYADETDSFINSTPDQVISILRDKGKFIISDDTADGIALEIRYYANMEINTADLYRIIEDMENNNQHVIGLILDYIKRINSVYQHHGDETVRVTYVAKELKTLALTYDIPVITAQQINRMGNATVDAAMRNDKHDLIRYVGNSDIGGAWSVIEESDWVAIINLEKHVKTDKLYLTIKRTKNRSGKSDVTTMDYFNHPFTNDRSLKLMTDVDKDGSVSILSLASDLNSVDLSEDGADAQSRPVVSTFKDKASRQAMFSSIGVDVAA